MNSRIEKCGQDLIVALVILVIGHLHWFRSRCKLRGVTFAPAVSTSEFYKVLSLHFWSHQLMLDRSPGICAQCRERTYPA